MNARSAAAVAIVLWIAASSVSAHRLDEYLQATTIAVGKDRVEVRVCLTPGVAVARAVLVDIDTDGDGLISDSERLAYGERVRRDLSLALDGGRLRLRLVSSGFPGIAELREGVGDILLKFEAVAPPGGPERALVFENRHQVGISVYLVNCLLPNDSDIRITHQNRNYAQSSYRLDYTQGSGLARRRPAAAGTTSHPSRNMSGDKKLVLLFCLIAGIRGVAMFVIGVADIRTAGNRRAGFVSAALMVGVSLAGLLLVGMLK